MVIFRIVQGASAGFIMTLVVTLLVMVAGKERMGRMILTVGIPTVLGPILGPVIGAIILQFWSWRVIFFINVPVGTLAIIMMFIYLPNFTPSNVKAKFDFIGIILLGAASATLIYSIAILLATWEELENIGYNRLTMEFIARKVGTSKAVLYRRWNNKFDLASTAFRNKNEYISTSQSGR